MFQVDTKYLLPAKNIFNQFEKEGINMEVLRLFTGR